MSEPSPKLTPWFPGNVPPARQGVYERDTKPLRGMIQPFAKWDGQQWLASSISVVVAQCTISVSAFQPDEDDFNWRGLAKEPKP